MIVVGGSANLSRVQTYLSQHIISEVTNIHVLDKFCSQNLMAVW